MVRTFIPDVQLGKLRENIAFARGGAHLPIAHALRLLFLEEIEIEKK